MFEWSLSLHGCMYASLAEQVPRLSMRPNIIVSDFATYAGFDIADTMGIPFSQLHIQSQRERTQAVAELTHSTPQPLVLLASLLLSREQR